MKSQNLEVQELSLKEQKNIEGGAPNRVLLALFPILYGVPYLIGKYA